MMFGGLTVHWGYNNEYAHIMITLQNKIREHILPLIRV